MNNEVCYEKFLPQSNPLTVRTIAARTGMPGGSSGNHFLSAKASVINVYRYC